MRACALQPLNKQSGFLFVLFLLFWGGGGGWLLLSALQPQVENCRALEDLVLKPTAEVDLHFGFTSLGVKETLTGLGQRVQRLRGVV